MLLQKEGGKYFSASATLNGNPFRPEIEVEPLKGCPITGQKTETGKNMQEKEQIRRKGTKTTSGKMGGGHFKQEWNPNKPPERLPELF